MSICAGQDNISTVVSLGSRRPFEEQPFPAHDIDHVWEAIESGNCVIWPTDNSCTVVEIVEHPTGIKTLNYWLAGGDLEELKRIEEVVSEYGRKNGFYAVTILGRQGWQRALPGYEKGVIALCEKVGGMSKKQKPVVTTQQNTVDPMVSQMQSYTMDRTKNILQPYLESGNNGYGVAGFNADQNTAFPGHP